MQADKEQVKEEQRGLDCLLRGGDSANMTTFQDYIKRKPPRCALLPGLVSAAPTVSKALSTTCAADWKCPLHIVAQMNTAFKPPWFWPSPKKDWKT